MLWQIFYLRETPGSSPPTVTHHNRKGVWKNTSTQYWVISVSSKSHCPTTEAKRKNNNFIGATSLSYHLWPNSLTHLKNTLQSRCELLYFAVLSVTWSLLTDVKTRSEWGPIQTGGKREDGRGQEWRWRIINIYNTGRNSVASLFAQSNGARQTIQTTRTAD